jgi:hypothetical protein
MPERRDSVGELFGVESLKRTLRGCAGATILFVDTDLQR